MRAVQGNAIIVLCVFGLAWDLAASSFLPRGDGGAVPLAFHERNACA